MSLVTFPRQFLVDLNGTPRVGAKATFYQAGTSTLITVYTTPVLDVPHTNPVESLASGLFPAIYINEEVNPTYKLLVTDSNDVPIPGYPEDNIPSVAAAGQLTQDAIATVLYPDSDAEQAAELTIVDRTLPHGQVRRYGDIDDPAAWEAAEAQAAELGGVRVPNLPIHITDFGGKADDATHSNTAALNDAVEVCVARGYRKVVFPGGDNTKYYFNTQPEPFPVGIDLIGDSARSFLVRNYTPDVSTDHFLNWDGSVAGGGDAAKGGGIHNLSLFAASGTSGGHAIVISGADATNRPGFMDFDNVVITGDGSWGMGIEIDGSNITTSGSQGQRDLSFRGIYIFRCSSDYVHIDNGVHVHFNGLSVFDGGLGGSPVVLVTGGGTTESNSIDVELEGLNIHGALSIEESNSVGCTGRVEGTLTVAATAVNVSFIGTANTLAISSGSCVVQCAANGMSVTDGIKLRTSSLIDFSAAVSTSAAAGGASALPGDPTGYLHVKVDGTDRRIPYWSVAP